MLELVKNYHKVGDDGTSGLSWHSKEINSFFTFGSIKSSPFESVASISFQHLYKARVWGQSPESLLKLPCTTQNNFVFFVFLNNQSFTGHCRLFFLQEDILQTILGFCCYRKSTKSPLLNRYSTQHLSRWVLNPFVCLFVGSGRGRYYDPRTTSDKKCRQTGVYVMNGTETSVFDTFSEQFFTLASRCTAES